MNRIASWLALIVSLAVVVVSLYEINHRQSGTNVAAPTAVPSPSSVASPLETEAATSVAPSTSEETATSAPASSVETATSAPAATETVAPPPTATPEPAIPTHNPTDTSGSSTPHTGANPVPAGVGLTIVAGVGLVLERRTRRSY